MAIESDQLVFDYLSRVGDLAQQRQLSSHARMRLVTELRAEIDKRRGRAIGGETPASVRRMLDRIGAPEELVAKAAAGEGLELPPDVDLPSQRTRIRRFGGRAAQAGGSPGGATGGPVRGSAGGSAQGPTGGSAQGGSARAGDASGAKRRPGLRKTLPRPRRSEEAAEAEPQRPVASPPHLAGEDELGPSGSEPDWWRVDARPFGPSDTVPGFTGGIEIPEILKPPPKEDEEPPKKAAAVPVEDEADDEEDAAGESVRRRFPRLRRAPAERSLSFSNPLLLIAAALLVAGAVMGSIIPLVAGWGIAYASRRLTPNEAKFAVLWVPGLAMASGMVWLWGRVEGRWGEAVADDAMGQAVAQTWPWVVRGAAVASALFLVWRSQRRARGE
ncbi:hypothetical protein H9Y04_28640 [Streptomyces sp. TRM66268-LWL]|uniref:Integral membrane protein n=1 Tax=Streptomyces polyasparticus TaxID=2767826 RepID=A0ABR7SNE7_9ACTN|nr:hypothetical protein [Streptomyces polyasparticus]MBC9716507.1 hypothetical protein [Streptomyces polyasparticus]